MGNSFDPLKDLISNDIKNSTDDHPGLFAHREWADGIINFINTTEL